jgi:hypothetical protein
VPLLVQGPTVRTGAHWLLNRAEAILHLCALKTIGEIRRLGRFILPSQRDRAHRSSYADDKRRRPAGTTNAPG